MKVLAGDIGGTNARLAIFDLESKRRQAEIAETFPSREYSSLEEIVERFMASHDITLRSACFGVPGPVKDGRAEITNLPWVVEAAHLAAEAAVERVAVINDLEAQAWGIGLLDPDDFVVLNPGNPDSTGNSALIAAGTGLGQAGLYWDGSDYRPFACACQLGTPRFRPRPREHPRFPRRLQTCRFADQSHRGFEEG
jgi:glucokinase